MKLRELLETLDNDVKVCVGVQTWNRYFGRIIEYETTFKNRYDALELIKYKHLNTKIFRVYIRENVLHLEVSKYVD